MSFCGAKDGAVRAQAMALGGGDESADVAAKAFVQEADQTSAIRVGAEVTDLVPGQVEQDEEQHEEEEEEEEEEEKEEEEEEEEEWDEEEEGGEEWGQGFDSDTDDEYSLVFSWTSTVATMNDDGMYDFESFGEIVPAARWYSQREERIWSSESSNRTKNTQCCHLPKFIKKLSSKIRVPNFRRALAGGVAQIRRR